MRTVYYRDARRFLDDNASWLAVNVGRHQLILGIAETVRAQPDVYPVFNAWAVLDGDRLLSAASCTPPYNYVLADSLDSNGLEALVAAISASEVPAPGVIGNSPSVEEFVRMWSALTGQGADLEMSQGVFALESVEPLQLSRGREREAVEGDRDQLIGWWHAFLEEALPDEAITHDVATARVDQRLDGSRPQGISVWEVDGEPVSMSAYSPPVANSIRIGPVYTPPEIRGRGYATALVATQSRRFLADGRDHCLLYTDLANPTSNAIYRRIGYHQVGVSLVYKFVGNPV